MLNARQLKMQKKMQRRAFYEWSKEAVYIVAGAMVVVGVAYLIIAIFVLLGAH